MHDRFRRLEWYSLALLAAAILAFAPSALADPPAPSPEDDAKFATSFVGKDYDNELDIDGWNDAGGGLVAPPIFVHEYLREDGTILVLTSREVNKESAGHAASYEVTDALILPPPQDDVQFSIECVQGDDETLRFLGLAKGDADHEWWTDVRRAWEISLETGKISQTKPKGIRCTNVSWGQ